MTVTFVLARRRARAASLDFVAYVAGIYYAPAALMLLLILSITIILMHYSTVISKLSRQNRLLAQELALLKHEIKKELKSEGQAF